MIVDRALGEKQLQDENVYLKQELAARYTFANIIGKGSRMQEIFRTIERIGKVSSTVLLTGESGTGKELIARAIHYTSIRKDRKFVSINCGALPETLLESELFGHERGAFTGAVKEKRGLFTEADNGTLFLDEISETSPTMQVKLLRAIQEKVIRKVGGNDETSVDVRIIAATNKDLTELVAEGKFREDLFYRINVIPIVLPPLRSRVEDIAPLTSHFIAEDLQGAEDPGEEDLDGGDAAARGVSLAGQRPRAREHARAHGRARARARDHRVEPARGDRARRPDARPGFREPARRRASTSRRISKRSASASCARRSTAARACRRRPPSSCACPSAPSATTRRSTTSCARTTLYEEAGRAAGGRRALRRRRARSCSARFAAIARGRCGAPPGAVVAADARPTPAPRPARRAPAS